jgi:hypothetical protein
VNRASAQRVDVRLSPSPRTWRALLDQHWDRAKRDDRSLRAREQLGLPTDAPIVMTGHQPIVFHPGVLSKYIAAEALGAHVSWLIVDKDETDPGAIDIPRRGASGALERETVRLLARPSPGFPAGVVPAAPVGEISDDTPWMFVNDGMRAIRDAMSAHEEAPSLAEQGSHAAFDMMRAIGLEGAPLLSSRMAQTDLFAALLDRMKRDPLAFVEIYNAAVARHADAGIPPLLASISADRYELPLWLVKPGEPRRRAYLDDLDSNPVEWFASRAIMLTLVMRLGACDLFIHGTGGFVYDRITEDLARDWLGEELAPMTLATATLTLPLLEDDPPSERDVAHAKWVAHHAAHDPRLLGDHEGAARKRELLAEIERLPRRSRERAEKFREMQDLLRDVRASREPELRRHETDAKELESAHASLDIANARDWAFPLYPKEALDALCDTIRAQFAS